MAGLPVRAEDLGPEDALLQQTARYFLFADRFGWTPDQVDELPAYVENRMFTVVSVADEIRREEQERANKSTR